MNIEDVEVTVISEEEIRKVVSGILMCSLYEHDLIFTIFKYYARLPIEMTNFLESRVKNLSSSILKERK